MSLIVSPHVPWIVHVDGDDLVVHNIVATCFGGAYDKGDNGQTEGGVMNDGRDPNLLGVALPIRSTEKATRGSPLAFPGAHIPWRTIVRVWRDVDGESAGIDCQLIDNGPDISKYPTHALDLNPNVARRFASPSMADHDLPNKWSGMGYSYRIVGGAKWVS